MNTIIDYGAVCYKKNFLGEVIARMDFASPIAEFNKGLPVEFRDASLKLFPIEEPKKFQTREIEFTPTSIATNQAEVSEWNFWGKKREKRLTITQDCVIVRYTDYRTYEQLRNEFVSVVDSLLMHSPDFKARRLGLRYINKVTSSESDPLDWRNLINGQLLGLFAIRELSGDPARIFHNYEICGNEHHLRFQFGMPNPDYPAPIRQRLFILDYDAYYDGLLQGSEVSRSLDLYHTDIQSLFEWSITEHLREAMNE